MKYLAVFLLFILVNVLTFIFRGIYIFWHFNNYYDNCLSFVSFDFFIEEYLQ